jgi:hypothetical protein
MRILNQTKNILLANSVILANTPLRRMKGLLGRKEFKQNEAIILQPCNSIHTFFMRFPIDVIFVDKDNKIVKTISQLVPFRLSGIYFNAVMAIELPVGTIQASGSSESDKIALE